MTGDTTQRTTHHLDQNDTTQCRMSTWTAATDDKKMYSGGAKSHPERQIDPSTSSVYQNIYLRGQHPLPGILNQPREPANKRWMGLELNGIVSPETKTPSSVDNKKLHLYLGLLRSIPMKSFLHYRIKEHTCLLHNFIVASLSLGPTAIHWSRVSLRWVTPSWSWIPRTPLLPATLGIHISNVSEKGIL